jgi:hypothetical protein
VILALAAAQALAAPVTDEEVEKRMAAGANLSAVCRVEATLNQALSGQHCVAFLHWIRDDFSQIKSNLTSATAQAIHHFESYKTNLAIIAGIAKSVETAQAKPAE